MNVLTSMSRVLCGRWKLVISASTALIRTPGLMKIDVSPEPGWMIPSSSATVSIVRTDVVPTQISRPPARRAPLSASAASRVTW